MHPVRREPRRVKARVLIDHPHGTFTRLNPIIDILRPERDVPVQLPNLRRAVGAVGRLHGQDLRYKKTNVRVDGAHLVEQLAVGGDDFRRGFLVPDVVGSQVHEDDVDWVDAGGGEIGSEAGLRHGRAHGNAGDGIGGLGELGRLHAAVPFVHPVVGAAVAAFGAVLSADEADLGVGNGGDDVGGVELAREEGAPAALGGFVSMSWLKNGRGKGGRELTGLPVMESPRAMMRTCSVGRSGSAEA